MTNGGVAELLDGIPFTNVHSTPSPESLARLAALVDAGLVSPVVAATFAFDDIGAAFDQLTARWQSWARSPSSIEA